MAHLLSRNHPVRALPQTTGKVVRKPEPTEETQTVFVGSLDQKIPSDELKDHLYELFTPFGRIMDIQVAKRKATSHAPGHKKPMPFMICTAFVVFETVQAATTAKKLNAFKFFGRKICVQYARGKSDAVAHADGSYRPRIAANAGEARKVVIGSEKTVNEEANRKKTNILLCKGMPIHLTEEIMTPLFQQFPGFEDLTTFPGKKEMRVEFKSTEDAVTCVGELQGFKVEPQFSLNILYG